MKNRSEEFLYTSNFAKNRRMEFRSSRPMHTLFPPLETESEEESGSNVRKVSDDGSAISPGIRDNFEAMRVLLRAQHRLQEEARVKSADSLPCNIGKRRMNVSPEGNTDSLGKKLVGKSSGNSVEELVSRRYEIAVRTAVAVESEMSQLTSGIEELEALLAQEEDEEGDFIPFPALPPIVPDDSDTHSVVATDDSSLPSVQSINASVGNVGEKMTTFQRA